MRILFSPSPSPWPLLFLFFFSFSLPAASIPAVAGPDGRAAAALFAEGNALYRRGRYDEALARYVRAGKAGGDEGVLSYDRGNCLFRLGRYGEALHAYLTAERLRPRDGRVRRNIAVTLSRIGVSPPGPKNFAKLFLSAVGTFRPGEYRILGELLLAFFFFFSALDLWRGKIPSLRRVLFFLLPAVLVFCLAAAARDGPRGRVAVVVRDAALVYNEPSRRAEALFSLGEGEIVDVKKSRGLWLAVRDAGGHEGWAFGEEVREVRPLPRAAARGR